MKNIPNPAKNIFVKLAGLVLLGLGLVFCFLTLTSRWGWERDNTVELCLDGEELKVMVHDDPVAFQKLVNSFQELGVHSLAFYWDGREGFHNIRRFQGASPLALSLRPRPDDFASPDALDVFMPKLPGESKEPFFERIQSILFAGPAVWGFPKPEKALALIDTRSWVLPWVEMSRQKGLKNLAVRYKDRVIRAHSIQEEEMAKMTLPQVVRRFRRAVHERGVRFLYVRFFPGFSAAKNLNYVKTLSETLVTDGYLLGQARPRYSLLPSSFLGSKPRQGFAFVLALLGPLAFLMLALRQTNALVGWLVLLGGTFGVALLVATLLSTPDFLLGISRFRGVKVTFLLPLLLALGILFSRQEITQFLDRPITWRTGFGVLVLLGVGTLLLVRSGNAGANWVSQGEMVLRDTLEFLLNVRPRTKEFLWGYPLLGLGFFLRAQSRKGPAKKTAGWEDGRLFLFLGFVGPLSMVNTFCHIHTPLSISLWRTFHGVWLGGVGAVVLVGIWFLGNRFLKKK